MPSYLRPRTAGGTLFFTVVTFERRKILTLDSSRKILVQDYIHYNPVKHGIVQRVKDWPYSTFHHYVRQGFYSTNWGEGILFHQDEIFGE
jgi:REP element-mobilizing transposase RayT